jgi:hypothetical protein
MKPKRLTRQELEGLQRQVQLGSSEQLDSLGASRGRTYTVVELEVPASTSSLTEYKIRHRLGRVPNFAFHGIHANTFAGSGGSRRDIRYTTAQHRRWTSEFIFIDAINEVASDTKFRILLM